RQGAQTIRASRETRSRSGRNDSVSRGLGPPKSERQITSSERYLTNHPQIYLTFRIRERAPPVHHARIVDRREIAPLPAHWDDQALLGRHDLLDQSLRDLGAIL